MNTKLAQETLVKIISRDMNTFNVIKNLPLMEDGFESWYVKYKNSKIFTNLNTSFLEYRDIGIGFNLNQDQCAIYNIITEGYGWIFYSIELDYSTGYCVNFEKICYVLNESIPEIIKLSKDPRLEELINFI